MNERDHVNKDGLPDDVRRELDAAPPAPDEVTCKFEHLKSGFLANLRAAGELQSKMAALADRSPIDVILTLAGKIVRPLTDVIARALTPPAHPAFRGESGGGKFSARRRNLLRGVGN